MSLPHAETLARYLGAFTAELVACGVTDVCLCPGSRSTPLALTFARHPSVRVWTHLDERSCAYFALGMAKALRRPVAILCSSGTAALNFAPAVVEAFHARVPLIVLTADRPQELRDLGANQTVDQVKLYGGAVRWFVEMLLPEASEEALRYARMAAARAVSVSLSDAKGPVHLNFPFREPLVPAALPPSAPDPDVAALATAKGARSLTSACEDWLVRELEEQRRGLIVAGGQDDPRFPDAVARLAEATGYPVLADPLSGVRCGPHHGPLVLGAYDSFLRSAELCRALQPEIVLRFGAAPVSKPLATFLQRFPAPLHVLVSPDEAWRDPELTATAVVQADATAFCEAFEWLMPFEEEPSWAAAWQAAESLALAAVQDALDGSEAPSEISVFADLAPILPEGSTVFAGNSMPVRDLDGFFPPSRRDIVFHANRGASGIDGVVSTALGMAAADRSRRLVLVIGDLSFYHDLNGLLAAGRHGIDATIVLVNNDGGGIFSFLPQHDDPEHFELLFGTPHGLDFSHAAGLYGLLFQTVSTREAYRRALKESFSQPGVRIIEVRTEREANLELHQRIWQRVAARVEPLVRMKVTAWDASP